MDELISEDTNFQKASCALDASVQIYSSRVDDVYTSSFRVLENLNRTETQQTDAEAATDKGVSKKVRERHGDASEHALLTHRCTN